MPKITNSTKPRSTASTPKQKPAKALDTKTRAPGGGRKPIHDVRMISRRIYLDDESMMKAKLIALAIASPGEKPSVAAGIREAIGAYVLPKTAAVKTSTKKS